MNIQTDKVFAELDPKRAYVLVLKDADCGEVERQIYNLRAVRDALPDGAFPAALYVINDRDSRLYDITAASATREDLEALLDLLFDRLPGTGDDAPAPESAVGLD